MKLTKVFASPRWLLVELKVVSNAREKIMIVDDDRIILCLYRLCLSSIEGLNLSLQSDPHEARDAFAADPESFAMLITDFNMPDFDGNKLAQAVRDLRKDIRIVGISFQPQNFDQDLFDEVTSKPIHQTELRRLVQDHLAGLLMAEQ